MIDLAADGERLAIDARLIGSLSRTIEQAVAAGDTERVLAALYLIELAVKTWMEKKS